MFANNDSFLLATFEFFIPFAWIMRIFWIFGDIFRRRDLGGFTKTLWGPLDHRAAGPRHARQPDRTRRWDDRALAQSQQQMQKAQADYVRSVAAGSDGSTGDPGEQIASGKDLLDNGTITQVEFGQIKTKAGPRLKHATKR